MIKTQSKQWVGSLRPRNPREKIKALRKPWAFIFLAFPLRATCSISYKDTLSTDATYLRQGSP